jgi:hypothetical protein
MPNMLDPRSIRRVGLVLPWPVVVLQTSSLSWTLPISPPSVAQHAVDPAGLATRAKIQVVSWSFLFFSFSFFLVRDPSGWCSQSQDSFCFCSGSAVEPISCVSLPDSTAATTVLVPPNNHDNEPVYALFLTWNWSAVPCIGRGDIYLAETTSRSEMASQQRT